MTEKDYSTIRVRTTNEAAREAKLGLVQFGKFAFLTVKTDDGEIAFQLVALPNVLAGELRRLAQKIEAGRRTVAEWQNPTPAEVVGYFEASPVLAVHADDVRAALSDLPDFDQAGTDAAKLQPHAGELLDGDGPAYGYTRRAARILFGDAGANGGANLKRIKAAIERLQRTTTTGNGQNQRSSTQKAA